MSVRRRKAGLLGDSVTVTLDGDDVERDMRALHEMLEYNSPASRIERLRSHRELAAQADRMSARLKLLNGNADHALLATIASAETAALQLLVKQSEKKRSSKGGSSRETPEWHTKCVIHARRLMIEQGKAGHELSGICAKEFGMSDDAVRRVLIKAGLLKKKSRAK